MKVQKTLILVIIILLLINAARAQSTIPVTKGSIRGIVKDSINLAPLPQATIAIYKKKDSTLVKYQFNDAKARFTMTNLPLDTSMYIIVSYIGYKSYNKSFMLRSETPSLNFEEILLVPETKQLEEVSINVPPMIMRGDTIEFNADAFKLEPTAVVGDLLRKLPGVIIWGDGKITVNGKKVAQVMVEGKIFFSGDASIATDNLPKGIVNKIQVTPNKTQDELGDTTRKSTVNMNITLKKDKKSGVFGKLGGGYGSNDRYDSDLMLSFFSPKTQISLVGGTNNVNKSAMNVNDMMLNSGYRVGSVNRNLVEPNFNQAGISRQRSGGVNVQHDWNKMTDSKFEYFLANNILNIDETYLNLSALPAGTISRENIRSSKSHQTRQKGSGSVTFKPNEFNNLEVQASVEISKNRSNSRDSSLTESSQSGALNTTTSNSHHNNSRTYSQLEASFDHKSSDRKTVSKEDFSLWYKLTKDVNELQNTDINEFNSIDDLGNWSYYNRRRNQELNSITHTFDAAYASLLPLLSVRSRTNVTLHNRFTHYMGHERSRVNDFNNNLAYYDLQNDYLSNRSNFKESTESPSMRITRTFDVGQAGRFYRSATFAFILKQQFIRQKNSSEKAFQNIEKIYNNFMPSASLRLYNRNNKMEHTVDFTYLTDVQNPTVTQLAPLIDSTQQWIIKLGNIDLKQSYRNEMSVKYVLHGQNDKAVEVTAEIKTAFISRYISENIKYDDDGLQIVYPINVDNYRWTSLDFIISKPFQVKNHLLTLRTFPSFQYEYRPFYLDGQLNFATNRSITVPLSITCVFSNLITLEAWETLNLYRTALSSASSNITSSLNTFGARVQLNLPGEIMIGNSVRLNRSKQEGMGANTFTIWNASLAYRFTKQKIFELKFSANDILNRNTGVVNVISSNSITTGQVSRLPQYYMLSLSFFPRKFGFK